MKLYILLAVLAIAASAISHNDDFENAKATVQELLQSGKDDNACRDLAKASSHEVKTSIATQQKVLDGMSKGESCDTEGQDLIKTAKNALKAAKLDENTKKDELEKAQNKNINFGDFSFKQLTEGKCDQFFAQKVWKDAKQAVATAKQNYNNAKAKVKTATSAIETATNAALEMVQMCRCKALTELQKAVQTMNNKGKSAYSESWTKAAHMECVLDGKSPNQCTVPVLPVIKMVTVSKDVLGSCNYDGTWNSGELTTGGKVNPGKKFTLYQMKPQKFKKNDREKYAAFCAKSGMLPVGCGTSNYDCAAKSSCISMPDSWSCNMMAPLCKATGFDKKGTCLGYCTTGFKGCDGSLYTDKSSYPEGQSFNPICGKYV